MLKRSSRMSWKEMVLHKMLNIDLSLSRNYIIEVAFSELVNQLLGEHDLLDKEKTEPKSQILEDEEKGKSIERKKFSFIALSRSDVELYIEDVNRDEDTSYFQM